MKTRRDASDWHGLYREGWQGEIVPEAFAHPAKFARGLIRPIYQHLLDEGLIQPGDIVVDPFGGVALGAIDAMRQGLHWVGVELEPRFVDLGQQNIDLWNARYRPHFPTWGTARLVQGDSRELAQVLGAAGGAAVTGPPYTSEALGHSRGKATEKERALGSPDVSFSDTPHNLGNLPPGDLGAALTSPPYVGGGHHTDQVSTWGGQIPQVQGYKIYGKGYGATPGQLGAMREGAAASVTSPPWMGSQEGASVAGPSSGMWKGYESGFRPRENGPIYASSQEKYGTTTGNIGNDTGDTFWTAARTIVAQLYQVLRPGAPAVFVVKAFVRQGQRVDFPGQWRALCEACGFVLLHEHRAWLVEDRGAQYTLEGGLEERTVERKSFFRRLAENRNRATVLWDTLGRDEQATWLREAHRNAWDEYRYLLANPPDDEDYEPPYPTPSRILHLARMDAYDAAGKPRLDIDTAIDWETVLCMQKPNTTEDPHV